MFVEVVNVGGVINERLLHHFIGERVNAMFGGDETQQS